jgi:acetyl esterase
MTSSYQKYADGFTLSRAGMQWFWRHYLPLEDDARHSYAAPLQSSDLRGLPPALVITAEYDVLCDEGETYAERLADQGVPTELTRYNGMIHGFISKPNLFDSAREAVAQIAAALRRAFASVA